MAAQKRRDMQRRSAVGILNVGLFALTDQLLDLGSVAARGRVVESGIDAQLPLARRRLRDAYPAAQLGGANHESKAKKASRHGPAGGQTGSTPQDTTTWTSLTPRQRVDGVARLKVAAVAARAAGCPSRVPQFGMRSTGLIVVPWEESSAARLMSASG